MTNILPASWRNIFRYAAILAASVFVLHTACTLIYAGLEFDESFNLQVPLNLYLLGKYQTWYNGYHPFHYIITTGPTVLFPVYALFVVASTTSYMVARLVTFSFFLLLLWILYREFIGARNQERGAALGCAAAVMVLMVPDLSVMSVRVLGEIPGLALIAASYRLYASDNDKRVFASGLLMALAVLSKMIFLLAVVPVVLVIAADSLSSGAPRRMVAKSVNFLAGAAIPLACWQVFKLSSLGLSGYMDMWGMQRRFLESVTVGAPSNSLVDRALDVWQSRAATLLANINLPGALGYVFLALLLAGVALALYSYMQDSKLDRFYLLVLLFGIVHTGWWMLLNIVDYYRHLFPGILMLIAGIGLTLYGVYRSNSRLSKPAAALLTALFLVFASSGLGRAVNGLSEGFVPSPSGEAKAQAAYAEKVAQLSAQGYIFYGYEWLQVPELSYLSGVRFFSVYDKRSLRYLAKQPGVLIVSRYSYEKNASMSMDALSRFTDIGPDKLAEADFPDKTPYVFAPITKIIGRRIAPAGPTPTAR